jgi:hypothetical protein
VRESSRFGDDDVGALSQANRNNSTTLEWWSLPKISSLWRRALLTPLMVSEFERVCWASAVDAVASSCGPIDDILCLFADDKERLRIVRELRSKADFDSPQEYPSFLSFFFHPLAQVFTRENPTFTEGEAQRLRSSVLEILHHLPTTEPLKRYLQVCMYVRLYTVAESMHACST